jgi:hypothetical protein
MAKNATMPEGPPEPEALQELGRIAARYGYRMGTPHGGSRQQLSFDSYGSPCSRGENVNGVSSSTPLIYDLCTGG